MWKDPVPYIELGDNPPQEKLSDNEFILISDNCGKMKIISRKRMSKPISSAAVGTKIELTNDKRTYFFLATGPDEALKSVIKEPIPTCVRERLGIDKKNSKSTKLPRMGPKPDNKGSTNQSKSKIPSDSGAVKRRQKTLASPSPSSSQRQTHRELPKSKKVKLEVAKKQWTKTKSTNDRRRSGYNLRKDALKKNAIKIANKVTRKNSSAESSAKLTATGLTVGQELPEMESNGSVEIPAVENHQNADVNEAHQLLESPEQNITTTGLTVGQELPEMESNGSVEIPAVENHQNEDVLPKRNTTVIEELPRIGPKPGNKGLKNQSKSKIPNDSREVTRSQKRKNSSTSASPSPSSSQGQTQAESPKPKKIKHSSENEDSDFFWKNLYSFDTFADAVGEKFYSINDPNLFTMKLCHILGTRIIDLKKKLNERPAPSNQDAFNESIWITKDEKSKQFTYRIKRANGEYVKRNDMERKFRNKYMERLSAKSSACKGTPDCDHPPLGKKGRSNKIYDHLRKVLGWTMECVYCPLGNNHNMEQFTKHLKDYHFDEETTQHSDQESKSESED